MFHSYVMGVSDSIYELEKEGFIIQKDYDNYTVSFPKEKSKVFENYIIKNLKVGYFNEYISPSLVVFHFHLENEIKRFEVINYENEEVLALCEKLCECKFESLYSMLKGNHFYSKFID